MTCERVSDVATWIATDSATLETQFREALESCQPEGGSFTGDQSASAILSRYSRLVEKYTIWWDQLRLQDHLLQHAKVVDYSGIPIDLRGHRAIGLPLETLAAARGLRNLAHRRPGEKPDLRLRLAHLGLVLSLDATPPGPKPYALHLSVSNSHNPGCLTPVEQGLVLSLFFTPDEYPELRVQPGSFVPVLHFYLPLDSPDARVPDP